MYKLDTDECKNVTTEAVTSAYKKVPDTSNNKIKLKCKRIMGNKTVLSRVFIKYKNSCFPKITRKLDC